MALNVVWVGLFLLAGALGAWRWLTGADPQVFSAMAQATFDSAKTGFEVALGLTGTLTLWLGVMRVGEAAGAVRLFSKALAPLLRRVFPGLPAEHPAAHAMVLNFAANLLGLDNAATPAGLKAMKELETLNPTPGTASDHQVMFMVLHAASLTLFPVSIMALGAGLGARNPADIFLPILVASGCSVAGGFLAVALVQRLKLWDPVLLGWIAGAVVLLGGGAALLVRLPHARVEAVSTTLGTALMLGAILWFLVLATLRKVNAWEVFLDGAKEGFQTALSLIPFLVGILVAVGVFRASGGMDLLVRGIWSCLAWTGLPQASVGALPTMLMKPLSGSGARGLTLDAMRTFGVDSFTGRLSCLLQGSTDTTLYVIALYSGAIGLRKTRQVLPCALFADLCGFLGAFAMAMVCFR